MNFLRKVLTESRESDFKARYQTKFADQDLESIIKMVKTLPNGTKFLEFVGKNLPTAFSENELEKVQELLKKFVSVGPNLSITDINRYDGLKELETELKKHENKIRRQVQAIEGADLVYEDDKYTIVTPLTYKASCYYGAGTKWCTSSEQTQTHFNNYNSDGKLFYIMDKTLPSSNRFYKVALLQKYDGEQTFFDAPDKSFTEGWIFKTPEFERLMLAVDSYMQDKYADKIKLYSDKAALERERKRLEAERQAEITRQKLIDAQERRETGEWDPDEIEGDEESEGALANALLLYLIDDYNVDVLSDEDKMRINELKMDLSQIQRLIEDPNTSQERLESLEERRSDIENSLEDYENYIDVYNLIPEGRYLSMRLFSVVGTNEVDQYEKFAVGTYDQSLESAHRYVYELIADVGVDGFNSRFVSNFIDYENWEGYLKDFYEEDIYNNPDVYLDESDRELSYSQEQEVIKLEQEEKQLESMRLDLENQKYNLDDESEIYQDELDEIEEKIAEIEERMSEIVDEIDEIRENPEGDFDEDALENAVSERVDEHKDDPLHFYEEFYGGGDYTRFLIDNRLVDIDELVEGVINTDGIGQTINTYDGTESEVSFMGETYIVFRYE